MIKLKNGNYLGKFTYRNFEFYWLPYTNTTWTKTSNIVESGEPDKINFFNYWSEYVLENYLFKILCEVATRFPSKNEAVSKLAASSVADVKKVYYSHKIYATQRMVKFREMEYNVPREAYEDVFKEVVKTVNSKKFNIHFPIENRFVKKDNILMSPAFGRDSAYIEAIFRAHGGRPHWGKMNTLTPNDIVDLYPEFSTFMKHRSEQDPDNLFISPYLDQLLGVGSTAKTLSA